MKIELLFTSLCICLFSCSRNNKINREIKYYDEQNKLITVANFENGKQTGATVHFYPNGNIKDSMIFASGKVNGIVYRYDTSGSLSCKEYYYFGLRAGPALKFQQGQISSYDFKDFNKATIVTCTYDSAGHCNYLSALSINPNITDCWKDGRRYLELSAYLPRPPAFSTTYKLGITYSINREEELKEIKSKEVYWDTVLPVLPRGQNYYISVNLYDKLDSINKLYIEEMHDTLSPSANNK